MLFNSWQFLAFLVVVFITYFLLPKKIRHYFLLIASYFFYGFWSWYYIFLMLGTTLVSYFSGLFINKYQEKKKLRLFLLIISIVVSIGALFFFKYFNFVGESIIGIINLFGANKTYNPLDIILPVGISFYTFQTLSYVFDIYNKKQEPETNFVYYALYVSFFPQLVAGPIERPNDLIPQFKNVEGIKIENISSGLKMMVQGFLKKIVIADILATVVNNIYNDLSSTNALLIIIGTVSFALQIYGDFSGYSDIAVGVAKLFNINLSKNFNRPYKATSIQDFWRRWHISLSNWFRDYIYLPLGGSKVSFIRWSLNILVVFTLSGLWHGAALTFIIFGLIHAIYQIVGKLTKGYRDKFWVKIKKDPEGKLVNILRMVFTFILVCFAWIPFRANSMSDYGIMLKNLFTNWNIDFKVVSSIIDFSPIRIVLIVLAIISYYFCDLISTIKIKYIVIKDIIYILIICLIMFAYLYLKSTSVDSTFIYFQF